MFTAVALESLVKLEAKPDIKNYLRDEKYLIEPALIKAGYKAVWFRDGVTDNFGPLERVCIAVARDKKVVRFTWR
jgi:hypothetical protein